MKRLLFILFIVSSCAGEGNFPDDDFLVESDSSTIYLVQHLDSIRNVIVPEIEESKSTEKIVKNTIKSEKKLKKELKTVKKELKTTKKQLVKAQKEVAKLQKIAGKRNLIQKVLNKEVDSIEVEVTEQK
tara:strand:- start:8467 stop:8853 length:387 start_codon:yes stop_codon:yes gene_type:complete